MALNPIRTITIVDTYSTSRTETRLAAPAISDARHNWTIENFSRCCKEDGSDLFLQSLNFRGGGGEEWRLKLWPNGKHNPVCLSIDLWCNALPNFNMKSSGEYVEVEYRFSILNDSQVPVYKSGSTLCPEIGENECQEFIPKNYLIENHSLLLPEDSLTIQCQITTNTYRVSQVPESKVDDHWKSILESPKCGDFIIEADGKEFLVYKGVLQIRCPVFAAMLEHSFEEQITNRVVIEDVKHEVVQEMLTYIYTDKAPNLKDVASDLLIAADKYDLERLKVMCEEALCEELTKENAIDVLMFADIFSAAHLKKYVIDFIAANMFHFVNNETLESAITRFAAANRPNLRAEVIQVTATSYNPVDTRSEATFTFEKKNFSKMKGKVLSPPCMIRSLPWNIMIRRTSEKSHKSLGFFLQCNSESKNSLWCCAAYAELVILSQKEGVDNFVRTIRHVFGPMQYDWGFHHFLDWNDVMDPEKGFIKNDTVIFQVRVETKVPHFDSAPRRRRRGRKRKSVATSSV